MTKHEYFSFSGTQDQFDKALIMFIQNLVSEERHKLVPPENVMRYKHGTRWITTSSNVSRDEKEMKPLETVTEIYWKDIREHNLEILSTFVKTSVKQIFESYLKMMIETVSEMCENTGRTVEGRKDKSIAELYIEGLRSVEFGVDREGRISMPFFFPSNPRIFEDLKKDAESKGREFDEELQKVIKEKSEKALEREKKRLAKFKTKQ